MNHVRLLFTRRKKKKKCRKRGRSKTPGNAQAKHSLSHFWVGHNVFYASWSWEHMCPFGLFLPSRWWLFTTTIYSSFNPLVAVTGVANLKAYKISRSSRLGVANLKAYKISRSSWLRACLVKHFSSLNFRHSISITHHS